MFIILLNHYFVGFGAPFSSEVEQLPCNSLRPLGDDRGYKEAATRTLEERKIKHFNRRVCGLRF